MAGLDRDEADKLILEYIQKLRSFPTDSDNAVRIFSGLRLAVFPLPLRVFQGRNMQVAGKEAMRAYFGFLIETLLLLGKMTLTAPRGSQANSMRLNR